VLAKESIVLVLLGYAIWRRDRQGARLAAIPAAAAAAWWCALRLLLPHDTGGFKEFAPGNGLWVTLRYWLQGGDVAAAAVAVLTLGLAVVALRRGALRGPLGWPIVLQLVFLALLGPDVIALQANSHRAVLPLLALAAVAYTSKGHSAATRLRAVPASTR
jgi:hypothetical protein